MVNEMQQIIIKSPENNESLLDLKNDLPELAKYIESSRAFFTTIGVNLEQASYDSNNKELRFESVIPKEMQGYDNIVHGGTISALLDAASGVVALVESSKLGNKVVTAELNIKFNKPLIPGEKYTCIGKIQNENSRLLETSGSIQGTDNKECASSHAKMFVLKK